MKEKYLSSNFYLLNIDGSKCVLCRCYACIPWGLVGHRIRVNEEYIFFPFIEMGSISSVSPSANTSLKVPQCETFDQFVYTNKSYLGR
jgi:hypothetical protein